MIKYVAMIHGFYPFNGKCNKEPYTIYELEIERETAQMVYFKDRRYAKTCNNRFDQYEIFSSEKEALAYLNTQLLEGRERTMGNIKNEEQKLALISSKLHALNIEKDE